MAPRPGAAAAVVTPESIIRGATPHDSKGGGQVTDDAPGQASLMQNSAGSGTCRAPALARASWPWRSPRRSAVSRGLDPLRKTRASAPPALTGTIVAMTVQAKPRPHWATCVRFPRWQSGMRDRLRDADIDAWRVPLGDVDEPVDVTLELFADSPPAVRSAVVRALPDCELEWESFVYEPTPWPEPTTRFDWDVRGPLGRAVDLVSDVLAVGQAVARRVTPAECARGAPNRAWRRAPGRSARPRRARRQCSYLSGR